MWGIRFAVSLAVIVLATTALLAEETAKKAAVPATKPKQTHLPSSVRSIRTNTPKRQPQKRKPIWRRSWLRRRRPRNDDSSDKFVLLRVARDLAAQAGDSDTAFGPWINCPRASTSMPWK